MRKRVISWLLTVVMVVSMLPTSVLADTLAADQEQQTQQEQIAPVDTENTVPAGNEETQEQQEPAPETPAPQMARSGGTALALAEGTVSSAKEFAEMDASGSYTLTKDIIVTEPYASDFSGTFDGNGHTVTLDITASTANVGLFSKLAGGAVVRNVITAGSVTATGKNNVGGIAGVADTELGAITISNCKNEAAIKGNKVVGGILGGCTEDDYALTISACANEGNISGTRNIGGICGTLENAHFIKNCYNSGAVTGSTIGGILGRGARGYSSTTDTPILENCYNVGNIVYSGTNGSAIVGTGYAKKPVEVKNCYALEGSASLLVPADNVTVDSASSFKTETEMKSPAFAALLGDGFMVKSGNYPALSWETPTAAVRFTIAPANATLEINGGTYTGSTTVALPAADAPYSYTVS